MTRYLPCDKWVSYTKFQLSNLDMSIEGVFRKNGNIRRLKELAEALDKQSNPPSLDEENPVQFAALLKKFLRELPDPLLTSKLQRLWIASQRTLYLNKTNV